MSRFNARWLRDRVHVIAIKKVEVDAYKVADELVAASPVLTGWLKSRWHVNTKLGEISISNDSGYADYANRHSGFIDKVLSKYV